MADDIVTRLQAYRDIDNDRCCECGHWTAHDDDCMIGQAAATIGRLRATGDALAEALHGWCNGMDAFTDDAERLRAWQEARRG